MKVADRYGQLAVTPQPADDALRERISDSFALFYILFRREINNNGPLRQAEITCCQIYLVTRHMISEIGNVHNLHTYSIHIIFIIICLWNLNHLFEMKNFSNLFIVSLVWTLIRPNDFVLRQLTRQEGKVRILTVHKPPVDDVGVRSRFFDHVLYESSQLLQVSRRIHIECPHSFRCKRISTLIV